MLKRAALSAIVILAALPAFAQRSGPATNAYMVQYVFRDGADPATATERHYSLLVNGEHKASFKVGNKTPVVSGTFQPDQAGGMMNTQFTYLDLGVNIECSMGELDTRVELHTTIDISAVAPGETGAVAGNVRNPVIRQTRIEVNATIPIGKPTLLASITDPTTQRSVQVEATVRPAN